MTVRHALRIVFARENLRSTLRIAAVVGLILTAVNSGDVILSGEANTVTALKSAFNFVVPFVVSNLGLLAGKRADWGR